MTDPERPFDAPWQAQAFALTVACSEAGAFSWPDWAATFGAVLAEAGEAAGGNDGYWQAWIEALERLLVASGRAKTGEITALAHAWQEAARRTPHGTPITL
ncbi:MAG: nitrile hydratase accessory protein [Pseudomonadota bacterium]